MNLYLLRHGDAENSAVTDAQRSLTANGREDVIDVANQFVTQGSIIDRCIVSPYLRAQQTAKLFLSVASPELVWETDDVLVPEVRALQVMSMLETLTEENVLLISHNPLLSELLALLTDGNISHLKIVSTSELLSLNMQLPGLALAGTRYHLSPEAKLTTV